MHNGLHFSCQCYPGSKKSEGHCARCIPNAQLGWFLALSTLSGVGEATWHGALVLRDGGSQLAAAKDSCDR